MSPFKEPRRNTNTTFINVDCPNVFVPDCFAYFRCAALNSAQFLFVLGTRDMAESDGESAPLDFLERFNHLLSSCLVPEEVQDKLHDSGDVNLYLFGFAPATEAALDQILDDVEEKLRQICPAAAALRRAWSLARQFCTQANSLPAAGPSIAPAAELDSKLSSAAINEFREKFLKSYPGELLSPRFTPGPRLLNMTHDMIKAKQLRWVPWRFRASEADEEAWLATRPPRSDASMLKSLLAHTPEEVTVSVPDQPTSLVLPQFQTLLQNSLAMVGAAHLSVLKKFHSRFFELATMLPLDPGLRPPTLQEVLLADQQVWLAVATVQKDHGWDLNTSLHEIEFGEGTWPLFFKPAHVSVNDRIAPCSRTRQSVRSRLAQLLALLLASLMRPKALLQDGMRSGSRRLATRMCACGLVSGSAAIRHQGAPH